MTLSQMSTILVDDTRGGAEPSHEYTLPFEVEELSKLKQDRYDSYIWSRNLRFLVFDGLDDDEGYPRRDDDVAEVTFKDGTKTTMPLDEFLANEPDNVLMSDAPSYPECPFCLQWPRFPRGFKPRTFQIVQFPRPDERAAAGDEPTVCTHFLAVSYCCPRDSDGIPLDNTGTYRVQETSDDDVRSRRRTRAPDGIIDRAVASAIDFGLRMIWIDQECILQASDADRNVGIQAMDLVYEQASATVGILNSCVISQDHIYALDMLDLWMDPVEVPSDFDQFEFARVLTDFLTIFGNDRYHTRAWTFQEILSASENGMLVFDTAGNVDLAPDLLGLPSESMLFSNNMFPIATNRLLQIIQQSQSFADYLVQFVGRLETRDRCVVEMAASLTIASHRLETFHPQLSPCKHLSLMSHSTEFGARRTCNAAVASTLLKTRDNSRVADRLAIIANLCGYEVRLDLDKVERRFRSLTTCILALSLLNGDLSLLTPEIYRPIPEEDKIGVVLQRLTISEDMAGSRPSWLFPIHDLMPSIRSLLTMPGFPANRRNEREYVVKASFFSLPGYLWSVDRWIDMAPVKRLCEVKWRRLLVLRRNVEGAIIRNYSEARLHGLDDEYIMAELESLTTPEPSNRGNRSLDQSRGRQDLEASQPDKGQGVLALSADIIEDDYVARNTLTEIFWEILSYLHTDLGEVDVANSVWHSIRTDCIVQSSSPRDDDDNETEDPGQEEIELPDEVSTILEHGKHSFSPFWSALQLDKTHPDDDSYHQIWLIERIMNEGHLWVGNSTTSRRTHYSLPPEDDGQQPKPKSRILSDQSISNVMAGHMKTLRQRQGRFSLFKDGYEPEEPAIHTDTTRTQWEPERETRMAVFDVDDPCTVFTPFDNAVEILPRPDCRSFSWCWVVEEMGSEDVVGRDGAAGQTDDLRDVMRVLGRVRGMWELMQQPEYNYRFA